MRRILFSILLLLTANLSAFTQTLRPLANGAYPTSATDVVAGVPPTTYKVNASISGSEQDAFTMAVTTNGRYEPSFDMARVEGNVFARKNDQGLWITPCKNYVVLSPGVVMELYIVKGLDTKPELDRVIAIAPEGSKFGELKKTAKEHAEAFDFVGYNAKLEKANVALKQKAIDDAAAAKAAAAKAAEEKRIADEKAAADRAAKNAAAAEQAKAAAAAEANADICASLSRYHKMAATNFKEIQGGLNAEATEDEEEDVFNTTEKLPGLKYGMIVPTFRDGVKKVQFFTFFESQADADAKVAALKAKLDACYKSKGGFTATVDSGIYFYKSATVTMELMRSSDISDEGSYKALIQITRK